MPMPVVSSSSSQVPAPIKQHGHSLSSATTISYPHPSIHPPLRLLTTATCIEACTSLISAQSPPHSPTFTPFVVPSSTTTNSSAGSSSSRANSILDGIQNALGGALTSSSPPPSATSIRTFNSSYSAAKESLADFSIAASKRSNSTPAVSSIDRSLEPSSGGVIRSRSNYVSFPNFDEVDFVDVAMVDDNEEDDDEDDHPGWAGPDSPPEGQRPSIMDSSLNEKNMRSSSGLEGPSRIGLGMPTSPSQHWLLQLETYQALQVNGV
ncbi:hypothetical protein BGZ95_006752 [Linnemannia exigua]|uniref:Uncharacterized protein n=1 Tax=Linnemannia exigua TaxID=604196 RepID=A0AAD4D135_9FUNG|nr:hypothetical protein BGZ95_006752 [Linnemannia exigua]